MPAITNCRGHELTFDPEVGWWRYDDNGDLLGDPLWSGEPWILEGTEVEGASVRFPDPFPSPRPCILCGEMPTSEGHDPCLGTLPGIVSACCGHGDPDRAYRKTPEDVERCRIEIAAKYGVDTASVP